MHEDRAPIVLPRQPSRDRTTATPATLSNLALQSQELRKKSGPLEHSFVVLMLPAVRRSRACSRMVEKVPRSSKRMEVALEFLVQQDLLSSRYTVLAAKDIDPTTPVHALDLADCPRQP